MDYNKMFRTKTFRIICWLIAGLIVFLLGFKAGLAIGFRKANFSFKWGDNYHKNFGGPKGGFLKNMGGADFIESNGVFGQIIKTASSTLVIKDRGEVEKIVLINDSTSIRRGHDTLQFDALKVDDNVVIIGESNEAGQIEAKLIRVMPPQPTKPPKKPF